MLAPSHEICLVDSQHVLHTAIDQKYPSEFSRCKRARGATACIVQTMVFTSAQSLALTLACRWSQSVTQVLGSKQLVL